VSVHLDRRATPWTFIYVIGAIGGVQKMGQTASPQVRLLQLRRLVGDDLTIHTTERVSHQLARGTEQRAHQILAPWKVSNELFDVPAPWAVMAVQQAAQETPRLYLSTSQVRAAKLPLGWSFTVFSARTQLSTQTLGQAMRQDREWPAVDLASMLAIRRTLEAANIEFISENGGGIGVRLRKLAP
jgi:hypothetical protein